MKMRHFDHDRSRALGLTPWLTPLLAGALALGCSSNRAPILGLPSSTSVIAAPTVTAVAPVPNATGVPINNAVITAAFSEPMAPITGPASFTVTAPIPANDPIGTVALDATGKVATFVLTAPAHLLPDTVYTANLTGATSQATGLPLANPYIWSFTTGLSTGLTRPRVSSTVPATTVPGPAGVPSNTAITATFTSDMNPSTLNAASFTLAGPGSTPVTGSVSYAVGSRTAVFTPTAPLTANASYTATITTVATDLASNALAGNLAPLPAASNYVWSFTAAAPDLTSPMVVLTNPVALAPTVAVNSAINATFSKAMDPTSLSTATFTLRASSTPPGAPLQGAMAYDASTRIATFTPSAALTVGTTYTAQVSGAKDLGGNALVAGPVPNPWSFTTGAASVQTAVALGSTVNLGVMATTSISNTGTSTVNGDVSLDPGTTLTGSPQVNGSLDVNDPVSTQAIADLNTAYLYIQNLTPGTALVATDLGAAFPEGVPAGIYTATGAVLVATTLTLDAGGDANAVWVFRIGTSLATSADIVLANGAQAKNVFWEPALNAQIGAGTAFSGTILAGRNISTATGATINGRLLAGATGSATVALQTTVINVPAQ
jgi:hypothetical protein